MVQRRSGTWARRGPAHRRPPQKRNSRILIASSIGVVVEIAFYRGGAVALVAFSAGKRFTVTKKEEEKEKGGRGQKAPQASARARGARARPRASTPRHARALRRGRGPRCGPRVRHRPIFTVDATHKSSFHDFAARFSIANGQRTPQAKKRIEKGTRKARHRRRPAHAARLARAGRVLRRGRPLRLRPLARDGRRRGTEAYSENARHTSVADPFGTLTSVEAS